MNTHANKTTKDKSQSAAHAVSQKQSKNPSTLYLEDNRPETVAQLKLQEIIHNGTSQHPIQKKENNTGLPDDLKSGIENLSGISMDDVNVHRNSDKPAQLQAHAYAQGTDIHLGPGQEKHLPHEAWHVVQQKQGRVQPTAQMKGKVQINDDDGLEKEADVMGAKASLGETEDMLINTTTDDDHHHQVVQAVGWETLGALNPKRYLPESLGGYTQDQMTENGSNQQETEEEEQIQQLPEEEFAQQPEMLEPSGKEEEELVQQPEILQPSGEEEEITQQSEELQSLDDEITDTREVFELQSEEISEESTNYNMGLAAAIFAAAVTWQTYRSRTGQQPRGRGSNAVQIIMADLDTGVSELESQAEVLEQQLEMYRNPFQSGFIAGIDPWPMPVSESYASLTELQSTLYRLIFLTTSGRDEMEEYRERMLNFQSRGSLTEGLDDESLRDSSLEESRGVRNQSMAGFGTGIVFGSGVQSQLPIFSEPITTIQIPWDTFHMVNEVAIRTERARREATGRQRALIRYNMRLTEMMGRRQIAVHALKLMRFFKK